MKLSEMFAQVRELRALGKAIAATAETEKRGLNTAEEKRLADLETQIKGYEDQIDAELRKPVNVPSIPEQRAEGDKLKGLKMRSVFEAMALDGLEARAMASGGAGTPKMVQDILDAVFETNPMRRIASVFTLPGDGIIPVPGSPSGTWGAEGATITPADITIAQVTLSAFNFNGGITVNDATLDDDFYNVSKMLSQAIGGYLGEQEGTAMFGAGAGADRPQGIFNGGTAVQTVGAAAVALADVITWLNSLATKWRMGEEKIILSPSVLAGILNLKDNTGRLELDSKSQAINGIPYVLTSLAPAWATATGTKLAALGNFKRAYAIGQRASDKGTIKTKIVPSATAFAQNVLFNERIDGRIVDAAAYNVLTVK